MKAALVIRASRDQQEMDSQREQLLRYAEAEGYTVPAEYIHEEHYTGMDGFDPKTDEYLDTDFVRPSIAKLQAQIERDNDLKLVIVYELTRLSRNPFTVARLVNWFNTHQVTLYIYDMEWCTRKYSPLQQKWVINDATIENIFAAANYGVAEWKKIRKRTKRGRDFKAEQGLYVGHLSDGYKVVIGSDGEKHIAIDEERSKVIQRIFDLYTNERLSTDKIAALLNAEGILTFNALEATRNKDNKSFKQTYTTRYTKQVRLKTDVLWAGGNVGQLLKNRWYIGERQYNGETYNVPPIVSKEQFQEAQELLSKNKTNKPKRRENIYPLRGLLKCGTCGSILYGHKVKISSSYYCSSLETGRKCGQEGISKQNIDSIIWRIIIDAFCSNIQENSSFSLQQILEDEKNKIYDFLGISEADKDKTIEEIKTIKKEIDDIEKQISITRNLFIGYNKDIKLKENKDFVNDLKVELNKCRSEMQRLNLAKETLTQKHKSKEQLLSLASADSVQDIAKKIEERISFIENSHNLSEVAEIFKKLITSVTLYQSTHYTKVIEVETINHNLLYALYNARRKRGYYIKCPKLSWKFDASQNAFITDKDIYVYECNVDGKTIHIIRTKQIPPHNMEAINSITGGHTTLVIYNQAIAVEELFRTLCNGTSLQPIVHIEAEPSDEEYQEWKKKQKEWYFLRDCRRKEKYKTAREEKEKELKKLSKNYLKIADMVKKSNLSYSTIWRDISRGILPAIKRYDTYLVRTEDFETYQETRKK